MTRHPTAELAGGAARRLEKSILAGVSTRLVGVGIDAVDVDRFRSVLARRPSMATRLCTSGELAYAATSPDPVPRLATRFAAKEAVMKALGVGIGAFRFHDVEVVREGLDAPRVVLHGAAAELARRQGAALWHLSLTHTATVALAVAVGERVGPGPGPTSGS